MTDGEVRAILHRLGVLQDMAARGEIARIREAHPNPLVRFGAKCFSQTDEDGITLEIIRRLGIAKGTYAEFGVGNGMENNTLILAALGWEGYWVGNESLAYEHEEFKRFKYIRDWITLDNIAALNQAGSDFLGARPVDVASLDLDGNDIHLVRRLLETGMRPRLFIVEYNAKFMPPVLFEFPYDPNHNWAGDDFFGASLASFADLFEGFGYRLVCCNAATGANAFFVRNDHMKAFKDVPKEIDKIWVGPMYHEWPYHGHRGSHRTVQTLFR